MAFNPPNPGGFQGQITAAIVAIRNNFQAIVNLNEYITSEGGASFLETVIGLESNDAAAVIAALGNHATLAGIYQGATPGAAFNYLANGEPLWSGQ